MKDYAKVGSTADGRITNLNVSIDAKMGLAAVESKARQAVGKLNRQPMLVSWWDGRRNMAGPLESCCGKDPVCARDYAVSHSASTRVSVNGGQLEFFYCAVPTGHSELGRDDVLNAHRGLVSGDRDDVIGG